jgi:hypothetical protein
MRRSGSFLATLGSLLFRLRPLAPEIGRDLSSNYADGKKVFEARLKARFPVGTSEQALLDELRRQGFERLPDHPGLGDFKSATFCRNELIFRTIWSVSWRSEGGRILEILGVYGCIAP